MKHDRASGHQHIADAGAFPVLLVGDDNAVLPDALVRLDAASQCILPDVRENISVPLEVRVNRFEVAETRVSHGYFFLNTKMGSVLKAPFPRCFNPT